MKIERSTIEALARKIKRSGETINQELLKRLKVDDLIKSKAEKALKILDSLDPEFKDRFADVELETALEFFSNQAFSSRPLKGIVEIIDEIILCQHQCNSLSEIESIIKPFKDEQN